MIQLGSLIDSKYRVDGHMGEGGMGFVVSARHEQLGTRVAIKFLHGHAAAIPEFVTRFQREARAASTIASRHVTRVLDVGNAPGMGPYMVMEYLVGRDLGAELSARGKLPCDEALDYVLQACEGLAHAHRARILHRDLKPANLFLTEEDGKKTIKLLDFGISKSLDPDTDSQLTATSAMLGTALYMAPEQLRRKKDVDERVDIWALGVILYELLAGEVPFMGDSLPEIITLILEGQRAPLPGNEIPRGVREAVNTCLSVDREARYRTVTDLAAALAPFADAATREASKRISLIIPAVGVPRTTVRTEVQSSRVPLIAASATLVALLLGVGGYAWSHRGAIAKEPALTTPALPNSVTAPLSVASPDRANSPTANPITANPIAANPTANPTPTTTAGPTHDEGRAGSTPSAGTRPTVAIRPPPVVQSAPVSGHPPPQGTERLKSLGVDKIQ
jgi:eukaryotic-like serine/threonine-protein kinase